MRRHLGKFSILVTLCIVAVFSVSVHYIINSGRIQRTVIGIINRTHFEFGFSILKFDILHNRIHISDPLFQNEETGLSIKAENIDIRYSPMNLLRGKLVLKDLSINSLEGTFPPVAGRRERSKRLGIEKLFILQNLEIENAQLENIKLDFAGKDIILADALNFGFKPRLSGHVELKATLQGMRYISGDTTVNTAGLTISGRTKLAEWSELPPYVNDIKGHMELSDLACDNIDISGISAKVEVKDKRFKLSDLELMKKGAKLKGSLEIDLQSRKFSADIDMPEPVPFPTLGSDLPTIDTQGKIYGRITAEGTGFLIGEMNGKIKMDLTHTREPLKAVGLRSDITIKNGIITLGETSAKIGDGTINIGGSADIPGKKMHIDCEGKELPLADIFGRFGDPSFHPIFGTGNAKAVISGWGKGFHVVADAETVNGPGGYLKIETDKARAHIDVTYHELNLSGEIEQNGKKTGDIALKIKYGDKINNAPRPKFLHIEANVVDNDLKKSFAAYGLTGIGNAHMVLDGPQRAFRSKIKATINEGSFAGIAFQRLSANTEMGFRSLKFVEGEIEIPNMEPIRLTSPINMDFEQGGFRIYGHPLDRLSFDAAYRTADLRWTIKTLRYYDLTASGVYSSSGNSDLNISGTIDSSKLSVFKQYIRDASGPVTAKLRISGPAGNPSLSGRIVLDDNLIYPRALNKRFEKLKGEIVLDGHTVRTEGITGTIDDGPFGLRGYIQHSNAGIDRFDVAFSCDNVRYVDPERIIRLEGAADVNISGTRNGMLVRGDVTILDGKYTKDFILLEGLTSTKKNVAKRSDIIGNENIKLDLRIRNTGDVKIKNNIGEVWLKIDIAAKGTVARPLISGTVETPEGKVHYLGKDFVITKGFIEFRENYSDPYLEITAEHEVPNITDLVITVTLHGNTNNLALDLSATKPMEQRDIVSLLLFGVTEQEMRDTQLSAGFGQSMVASQITHMMEQPVTKLTHLDTFRVESGNTSSVGGPGKPNKESNNFGISKIYLGKQLSDRLNFEFFTDVNSQNTQQNVRANYLLTDFLILKGQSSTDQQYLFNLSLRIKER